jgi:O-antigen/teichoic acid export membrane protein
MVSGGLHRAWSPFFLRVDAQGDNPDWSHVRRLSFFSLAAVGGVCLGVGLSGPLLIDLAATDDYTGAARTAAILALGAFLNAFYLVASGVIFASRKAVRWIAVVTVPSMLLNILLNLLWVPDWGIEGAAFATLVSSGVMALSAGLLARHTRKVPFKYLRAGLLLLLVSVLLWFGVDVGWLARIGLLVGYVLFLFMIDWRDISGAVRSVTRQLRERNGSA